MHKEFKMKKITIYGLITDCGDGSANMEYYFHESQAEAMGEMNEGFSEVTIKEIETYAGSNIDGFARANESGHFCRECYTIDMMLDEYIGNDGICSICRED